MKTRSQTMAGQGQNGDNGLSVSDEGSRLTEHTQNGTNGTIALDGLVSPGSEPAQS